MNARPLLVTIVLGLVSVSVRAQVAAEETFQLAMSEPAPWGEPIGPVIPNGTLMRVTVDALKGPTPLECLAASHRFLRTPAEGLFEGNLPAPAEHSAKALGLPSSIVTQRISCSNASFDVHRASDGCAWIGLDNSVQRWERTKIADSPEATVQSLLINHFAGDFVVSPESVKTQSRWLSRSLADKFNRWFVRVDRSTEVPALNGDPFTDSQESPESFELGSARIRDRRAELTVTFYDASDRSYPVHVQLVREQRSWRVDDLRYRDGQRLTSVLSQ